MNSKKRFDLLIISGFSFLILLLVAISLLGISGLEKTKTLFRETYQNAFQVLVETEHANSDLIAAHRAMKDVALSRSETQFQAALNDFNSYDTAISEYLLKMRRTDPGNALLGDVITAYGDWAVNRARTIELVKLGEYDLAAENTRTAGSDQVKLISNKMHLLMGQKQSEADAAYQQVENTSFVSVRFLLWMTVVAAVFAVLMSLYIRNRLLKAQSLLHEEKEKLQITFDSIGDGVITTDTNRNVLSLNKVAEEYTGWITEDAFGKPFNQVFDITNAYTGAKAKDPVEEVLTTDSICLLENHTILTSKDGTKRHIADSAAPIKDENAQTSGVVMIFRDVTERKMAEQLLKESEEKFRTIFEQSPIGIGLSHSVTGHIIELNDRFAEIIGRTKDEIKHIDWMSITHPEDLQNDLTQMALLNKGKLSSYQMEKRYFKPDSSIVWVNMSITLAYTQPEYSLHLCMVEDITQQKLAENELKISEQRLKTAQDIANVGNWEIDLKTNVMWASEQAFIIYGLHYDTPFLPLQAVQEAVRKEDRGMMDKALRSLLTENKPYDVQFAINRVNDNALRFMHSIAILEYDTNGKPDRVIGTIQDITELKTAELAFAQSNLQLEATLQSTADGIEAVDLEGNIIFCNEQFKKMWALSDDITDMHRIFEFITGKIVNPNKSLTNIYDFLKQMEKESVRELALLDGRTIERYSNPILSNGKILGYVLSYRDVSDRKHSEQALLASEAKHKAMIANISDSILIIDKSGALRYISPNMEKLFGWRYGDFKNHRLSEFIHPDDIDLIKEDYVHVMNNNGLELTFEFRLKCKDGRYKYIKLTAVNMIDDPNIQGILMNFNDISDSKIRENEILYLNYHDLLTGLYNRAFFEEECRRLDTERQLPISVIMGDINGLKLINDAFGHVEGDKLLVEIAKILNISCRKEDILARTGGDEFCILLPQTTTEEARTICKRIYDDCKKYESKSDKDMFYLSISLGYATKIDATVTIEGILTEAEEYMYKQKLLERKSMRSSLISSIKTTMNEKSHLTAEHEERLVALSKLIGQALDLNDVQTNELELLSTLHDIGKLSINDQILNKQGKLTTEEWIEIRKHPDIGYRIAHASPELMPIAEYILCHHERWDGTGYPQGLKGDSIPLLSRIVSVVDAFDAMTQDRPYRKAMPEAEAINEIIKNSGTQFDPEIAKIFVDIISGL